MITLVAEAALRSALLCSVVWLAMFVLRPRNPHLQKTVWTAVLLASLAMPFVAQTRVAPSFDVPAFAITLTQSMGDSARATSLSSWQWALRIFTALYAVVAGALLVRFATGLLAIWRLRRSATPLTNADGLDVRVSPKIASPATFGSTILLPATSAEWNESKLNAILSHERSHVKYRDCYIQWLAHVHACVFWFNPLAWWLNRRLAQLAETISDDAVIESTLDRTAYADLLLEIARHPAPAMVTSAARSNISARIERILSNIAPAPPPRRWVLGAAVVALIPLFALAAATTRLPTTQSSPDAAGSREDQTQPRIIDPDQYSNPTHYPEEAKRLGVEGWAMVDATIDEEGRVTYAQIVEIHPADTSYGFADAATRLAKEMRFDNPKGQPMQVKFRVKFALKDTHAGDPQRLESPRPAGG